MTTNSSRGQESATNNPVGIFHHDGLPHAILGRPLLTTVTKTFPVSEKNAQGDVVPIGELDLEWTRPATSPDGSLIDLYRGRLTFRPLTGSAVREVILSAYNIGLQGRRVRVVVHDVSTGVRFWNPRQPNAQGGKGDWYPGSVNIGNPLTIPKTNIFNTPPNADKIWGLAFIGPTADIWISSLKRVKNPMPDSKLHMLESHDTSPPPDEPGGDDGEE